MARGAAGILAAMALRAAAAAAAPGQRHLSYGRTPDTMIVMWATADEVSTPTCAFGPTEALGSTVACASRSIWQVGGISELSHECELSQLVPGQRYHYRVGDGSATGAWSELASFVARPNSTDWAPTVLVYGDLGVSNGVSTPRLVAEAASGENDFILHVGDFAYDMRDDGGRVGRAFMESIDPIASRLPYMTCVGNHEGGTDLDHISSLYHYAHRFWMPGAGDLVRGPRGNNMYYSFDAGPAHIVAFSSEAYFWQLWELREQFAFLEQDLAAVDRTKTPWVITMAHRPMYCTNSDGDDCTKEASNVRTGYPIFGTRSFQLEELFHRHGVDLSFWAHEHSYERLWPVYNNTVMNGTEGPYVDPGATVHIVSGSAGCREGHDAFGNRTAWSAFHSEAYGFGKLQILNGTHLRWRQFEAAQGSVIDELLLVRTRPRAPTSRPLAAPDWQPKARAAADVRGEQAAREAAFARARGCTARGAVPQEGCAAAPGLAAALVV